jgi:hypothetical protein
VTATHVVFVIKAENARSAKAVSASADIMSVVDSHAASRVLGKTEIFKIRDFARANPAALGVIGGDKTKAKLFTKAFNTPGAMRRLGIILGADAFNDNQDRVDFVNNGGARVGDPPNWIKLKCIQPPATSS